MVSPYFIERKWARPTTAGLLENGDVAAAVTELLPSPFLLGEPLWMSVQEMPPVPLPCPYAETDLRGRR